MASQQEPESALSVRLSLRLLIVEDNPDDAMLCLRILNKAHLQVDFDIVKTLEAFAEKVSASPYDVILADYNLGDWNGMEAFEHLRKEGREIPFIIVTGAIGDERAVSCIKSGASDCILKDRMERLPIAISRALEEKRVRDERLEALRSLEDSEAKFRALADSIPTAVFIEQGTQCHYVNRAAEQLTGYTRDELLTKNMWDLIPARSRKALAERSLRSPKIDELADSRYHTQILTKDGGKCLVHLTVGIFRINGTFASLITANSLDDPNGEIYDLTEAEVQLSELSSGI